MINQVNNISYISPYYKFPAGIKTGNYTGKQMPLCDVVCFSGKSMPSEYKNVFDYLAAEILAGKVKQYQINGSFLSANKIKSAIKNIFETDIFNNYIDCDYTKIKWKSYIPQDVRVFSTEKINKARKSRLNEWQEILSSPTTVNSSEEKLLQGKLQKNPSLKLVIWDAVTSELKADNRHIPVPFDTKALLETIERYDSIPPKDRAISCAKPSFIEYYTHRLRDNLLMKMGLSNNDSVWVKIPSIRHDSKNADENIRNLEILSNKNWCTRSSVDKAIDALTDGDFFIHLKRNKSTKIWEPTVGMASNHGKIDQIQGKDNDNIVPINMLDEIKTYIETKNLKCHSGIVDEGPKAKNAIMISEKLKEKNMTKQSFMTAIEGNDILSVFNFLNIGTKKLHNGNLVIQGYRPVYCLDKNKGLTVPYSMLGINEDSLLRNVEEIEGNLILCNKNPVFNSKISTFPPKLKSVSGRIVCNEEQYEKFATEILKVVNGNKSKIFIVKSK